ncbi:MAG: hypothetical protein V1735_02320 [Nanoarchaeota archaeon]
MVDKAIEDHFLEWLDAALTHEQGKLTPLKDLKKGAMNDEQKQALEQVSQELGAITNRVREFSTGTLHDSLKTAKELLQKAASGLSYLELRKLLDVANRDEHILAMVQHQTSQGQLKIIEGGVTRQVAKIHDGLNVIEITDPELLISVVSQGENSKDTIAHVAMMLKFAEEHKNNKLSLEPLLHFYGWYKQRDKEAIQRILVDRNIIHGEKLIKITGFALTHIVERSPESFETVEEHILLKNEETGHEAKAVMTKESLTAALDLLTGKIVTDEDRLLAKAESGVDYEEFQQLLNAAENTEFFAKLRKQAREKKVRLTESGTTKGVVWITDNKEFIHIREPLLVAHIKHQEHTQAQIRVIFTFADEIQNKKVKVESLVNVYRLYLGWEQPHGRSGLRRAMKKYLEGTMLVHGDHPGFKIAEVDVEHDRIKVDGKEPADITMEGLMGLFTASPAPAPTPSPPVVASQLTPDEHAWIGRHLKEDRITLSDLRTLIELAEQDQPTAAEVHAWITRKQPILMINVPLRTPPDPRSEMKMYAIEVSKRLIEVDHRLIFNPLEDEQAFTFPYLVREFDRSSLFYPHFCFLLDSYLKIDRWKVLTEILPGKHLIYKGHEWRIQNRGKKWSFIDNDNHTVTVTEAILQDPQKRTSFEQQLKQFMKEEVTIDWVAHVIANTRNPDLIRNTLRGKLLITQGDHVKIVGYERVGTTVKQSGIQYPEMIVLERTLFGITVHMMAGPDTQDVYKVYLAMTDVARVEAKLKRYKEPLLGKYHTVKDIVVSLNKGEEAIVNSLVDFHEVGITKEEIQHIKMYKNRIPLK